MRTLFVSLCLIAGIHCMLATSLAENYLLQNATDILDGLLSGYDKRLRPHYGGERVQVNISMYIYNIGPVSETNMEYTMDLYFRQQWTDPRLAFDDSVISNLALTNEMTKKIWIPDTYFINEKKAAYHMVLNENTLIGITPVGDVLYSTRLTLTSSCLMDLTYFPMDTQHCTLWMESYAYSTDHIKYTWIGDSAIYLDPSISLSQFYLLGHVGVEEQADYYVGTYSQLVGHFYLGRSMSYYAIQVYIPSSMIVILSWVSFWINPAAVPARVALGITTVLTMTTLMSGVNNTLPKLSYVKAIDYYLVICYMMVFAALVEFALVSYGSTPAVKNKDSEPEKKPVPRPMSRASQPGVVELKASEHGMVNRGLQVDNGSNSHPPHFDAHVVPVQQATTPPPKKEFDIRLIDRYSRICFPAVFILFEIIYWAKYLTVTQVDIDELLSNS